MKVTVLLTTYNHEKFIACAINSVLMQKVDFEYEVVILEDCSTDGTRKIVNDYAQKYPDKIRLVLAEKNECSNSGWAKAIGASKSQYIALLDGDDCWTSAYKLQKQVEFLDRHPECSLCFHNTAIFFEDPNWEGCLFNDADQKELSTLEDLWARCFIAGCSAMLRGGVLNEFPAWFHAAKLADWSLYVLYAHHGAIGFINEILGAYRIHNRGVWAGLGPVRQLQETIEFLESANVHFNFAYDSAIKAALLKCKRDLAKESAKKCDVICAELPAPNGNTSVLEATLWPAGFLIGRGEDARPLLPTLDGEHHRELDAGVIARNLSKAVLLANAHQPTILTDTWPHIEQQLADFLLALEEQSQTPLLTRRVSTLVERQLIESCPRRPLAFGKTYATQIELTEPIVDIELSGDIERLRCDITFAEEELGIVELPVCDGLVPAHILADAIADKLAWPIIGRYFSRAVYPHLLLEKTDGGVSVRRGDLLLARDLTSDDCEDEALHDEIGWTVFLQEVWGKPEKPQKYFYSQEEENELGSRRASEQGWIAYDICDELPDVETDEPQVHVIFTIGGAPVGVVPIDADASAAPAVIRAQDLRVAITLAAGYELCRVAVREGILGQPLDRPIFNKSDSLRERLKAARRRLVDNLRKTADDAILMLGRRRAELIGTSQSRFATLPSQAVDDLVHAAAVAREPCFMIPQTGLQPTRVEYAPNLIGCHVSPTSEQSANALTKLLALLHPVRILQDLQQHVSRERLRRRTSRATNPIKHSQSSLTAQVLSADDSLSMPEAQQQPVVDTLPILAYRRIAPEIFEQQLRFLRDSGYSSIGLDEWRIAMERKQPLPTRSVLLTFDDGYRNFLTYAWPILKRYQFSAIVFLVTDEVGGFNRWDRFYGEEVPLLSWEEILKLRDEGVEFGSNTASHRHLTGLSNTEVVEEAARSRTALQSRLGDFVSALAYPYGSTDSAVQHLVGASGYVYGFSYDQRACGLHDRLLALPRIEVAGSDGLEEFVVKVSQNQ